LITKFAAHCLPPRLRPWFNHSVPLRGKEFFSRLLAQMSEQDLAKGVESNKKPLGKEVWARSSREPFRLLLFHGLASD
jgi:hypothetical protein